MQGEGCEDHCYSVLNATNALDVGSETRLPGRVLSIAAPSCQQQPNGLSIWDLWWATDWYTERATAAPQKNRQDSWSEKSWIKEGEVSCSWKNLFGSDESLKLTVSIQTLKVSPNTDDDLCFQFASLFALMGFIITHRCCLEQQLRIPIECVILQTYPTKEVQTLQRPKQSRALQQKQIFTTTHYFPT